MKPVISIIIPCYNCADTLEEAVASLYGQHLSVPFEVIVINDASTDTTALVIERLVQSHPEIIAISHIENRGGGATRNTGIAASSGELIYCLDSDNFFAPDSLQRLIDFLRSTAADGAAFHERRFFQGTNVKQYTSLFNTVLERTIKIDDLVNDTHTLLDNFLYTRVSYDRTPGYPEHHGFDTQAFEMRYLAAGNTVRICPGSVFYHRQGLGEKSYFERVYRSGALSINYALVFEDGIHLLSEKAIAIIVTFPLIERNMLGAQSLLETIHSVYRDEGTIFAPRSEKYLSPDGREHWIKDHESSTLSHHLLIRSVLLLGSEHYALAWPMLSAYLESAEVVTPYIRFLVLRTMYGLAGFSPRAGISAASSDLGIHPIRPHGSIRRIVGTLITRMRLRALYGRLSEFTNHVSAN